MILYITPLERRALDLLAHDGSNEQLAACLGVRMSDVESRLKALFSKMDASNVGEAIAIATRRGLFSTISLPRLTAVAGPKVPPVAAPAGHGPEVRHLPGALDEIVFS